MKSHPSIAFVITCYNAERYISDTIESCLYQSLKADQIIVIDDKSTDKSLNILGKYEQLGMIKIIRNKSNVGKCSILNNILPNLKYKYIALIDSDDTSECFRLEKQVAYLERHPETGCCSGFVNYINSSGKKFAKGAMVGGKHNSFNINNYKSLEPSSIYYPTAMIRSEIFINPNLRFREDCFPSEDCDFWNRLVESGWKVDVIPEYISNYRVHLNSAWGANFMDARKKYRFVRECLKCRRTGLDEPSWTEYYKNLKKRSFKVRFNEFRRDFAKGNYRYAGIAYGENKKTRAFIYFVLAAFFQPSYALKRLLNQYSSGLTK